MRKPFDDLRERLLRGGVAPRHVCRYLAELADHLADLTADEECAGRSPADAASAAMARLGGIDELARAAIDRRDSRAWCARAPGAVFSLAPMACLAGAYFISALYLWCGWNLFIPYADTPFGFRNQGPIYALSNIYFQAGKFFYVSAPLLVGWGIALLAARQRVRAIWPVLSLALIAWMGGTAQITAGRTALSAGVMHIRIQCFVPGSAEYGLPGSLLRAAAIFSLAMLPYLMWRWQKHLSA